LPLQNEPFAPIAIVGFSIVSVACVFYFLWRSVKR
jgi:hypothetical protein